MKKSAQLMHCKSYFNDFIKNNRIFFHSFFNLGNWTETKRYALKGKDCLPLVDPYLVGRQNSFEGVAFPVKVYK